MLKLLLPIVLLVPSWCIAAQAWFCEADNAAGYLWNSEKSVYEPIIFSGKITFIVRQWNINDEDAKHYYTEKQASYLAIELGEVDPFAYFYGDVENSNGIGSMMGSKELTFFAESLEFAITSIFYPMAGAESREGTTPYIQVGKCAEM